jgi:hypothetical protein
MTLSVVRDMLRYRSRKALGKISKGDDLEGSGEMEKSDGVKDLRVQSNLELWYRSYGLHGGIHVTCVAKTSMRLLSARKPG